MDSSIGQDKLLTKINQSRYINKNISRYVFQSLPWLVVETRGLKLSFYCNIFLSQYCSRKCLVCISPKAPVKHNIFAHNIAIKN